MPSAITLERVSKVYRRYGRGRRFATLKSALLTGSLVRHLSPKESFRALDDVSLTVGAGAACGVIGRNGSGKSTLLKLIAGITRPTSGEVRVGGRVSALIELGAGFHPEISGRENVFINGVMLGMSRREIDRRFQEIVEFAEIEDFIEAPVKTYSSGMYLRLGFAVAVHVDPEILIVDEVLAVGDEGFSLKCLDKFAEFKRRGKTILFVSHALSMVERFCDEAVWLDGGRKRMAGDPKRVAQMYLSDVEQAEDAHLAAEDARARQSSAPSGPPPTADREVDREMAGGASPDAADTPPDAPASAVEAPDEEAPAPDVPAQEGPENRPPDDMFEAREGRWGSGIVRIEQVTLEGPQGAAHVFHSGEPMTIRMQVVADRPVGDFAFGIGIFSTDGVCCYGTNTRIEEMESNRFDGVGEVAFAIERLDLVEGTYKVDVAVHKQDGFSYDYHRLLYTFRVKSNTRDVGIYRPRHAWQFSGNIRFKPLQT